MRFVGKIFWPLCAVALLCYPFATVAAMVTSIVLGKTAGSAVLGWLSPETGLGQMFYVLVCLVWIASNFGLAGSKKTR